MNKTRVLLSAFIKSDPNFNRNIIFIFAIFLPTAIIWAYFANKAYDLLRFINRQDLILTMAFSMFPFVTFFSTILQTTINLYFSKKVENIIHLPFTPFDILSAKFAETMVIEYTMLVITLFPTMILFGYKTGCGFLYYLYSVLLFFFCLAFSVATGMSFAIAMMRLLNTRFLRPLKRALLSMLQYIDILSLLVGVLIGCAIAVNAKRLFIAFFKKDSGAVIDFFYSGKNGLLVNGFSKVLDMTSGLTAALTGYDSPEAPYKMIAAAAVCALSLLMVYIIGELLYFKGLSGIGERLGAEVSKKACDLKKNCVQRTQFSSLIFKEVKEILGSPVFFKYCFLVNFILPVSVLIFLISGAFVSTGFFAMFGRFVKALCLNEFRAAYMMNFFVISALFTPAASAIAASAFAREGTDLFIIRSLPVTYEKIISAKFLTAALINLSSSLLLIISVNAVVNFDHKFLASAVLSSILATVFMTASGLLAGLKYYDGAVDNQYMAVRGFCCNLVMFEAIVSGVILYFLARLKLDFPVFLFVVNLSLLVLAVSASYLLFARGKKLYAGI